MDVGDYWRMFRAKGWRLPVSTFRQVHLYDLRRGIDTASRVLKDEFDMDSDVAEHGYYYGPTWTSLMDSWYRWSKERMGAEFATTTFVDLGCGKGKALLRWLEDAAADGLPIHALGVEYYQPLVDIAQANLARMGLKDRCTVLCEDAATVDVSGFGERPIIYLCNPFDGELMRRTFERLGDLDPTVIYANPLHGDVLESLGYVSVHESKGWHANQWARAYTLTRHS